MLLHFEFIYEKNKSIQDILVLKMALTSHFIPLMLYKTTAKENAPGILPGKKIKI